MLTHRIGELARDIASRRRDVGRARHVILKRVRLLRIEEREAIVMLRRHHRITHARILRERSPLLSETRNRKEERFHLSRVFSTRNSSPMLNPLRVMLLVHLAIPLATRRRVQPKVNEHSKARITPPRHARITARNPTREFIGFGIRCDCGLLRRIAINAQPRDELIRRRRRNH